LLLVMLALPAVLLPAKFSPRLLVMLALPPLNGDSDAVERQSLNR